MKRVFFSIVIVVLVNILLAQNAYYLNEHYENHEWRLPNGWTGTMEVGEDTYDNDNPIMGAVFNQMWFGGGNRWATTPIVGLIVPGNVLEFKYRVINGYGSMMVPFELDENSFFHVYIGDDLLENVVNTPTTEWMIKTISLDDYIGDFISLTFFVQCDDVTLPTFQIEFDYVEIYYPQVGIDYHTQYVLGFDMPTVGTPISHTIRVNWVGSSIWPPSYTVRLMRLNENGDDELLGEEFIEVPQGRYTQDTLIEWTPQIEGQIQIYGMVVCPQDEVANNITQLFTLDVHPNGTQVTYIGDPESDTWSGSIIPTVPSSVMQTIYLAEDIGITGDITTIGLVFNGFGDLTGIPLSIYLAYTQKTVFIQDTPDWISPDDFTLVYDGDFIATEAGKYIVYFDFIEPYSYDPENGNLAVMVKKHYSTLNYSWENRFLQTVVDYNTYNSFGATSWDSDIDLNNLPTDWNAMAHIGYLNMILKLSTEPTNEMDNNILPQNSSLLQNYPNPFNPSTTISFMNAKEQKVKIDIYNIKGQKVSTLADKSFNKGQHIVVWNGTDDLGKALGSGIYLYRMETEGYIATKKMILIK